jgi:hypothetical protein
LHQLERKDREPRIYLGIHHQTRRTALLLTRATFIWIVNEAMRIELQICQLPSSPLPEHCQVWSRAISQRTTMVAFFNEKVELEVDGQKLRSILIDVRWGSAKDDYAPRSAELALDPPLHEASGAVFMVESHFP